MNGMNLYETLKNIQIKLCFFIILSNCELLLWTCFKFYKFSDKK